MSQGQSPLLHNLCSVDDYVLCNISWIYAHLVTGAQVIVFPLYSAVTAMRVDVQRSSLGQEL